MGIDTPTDIMTFPADDSAREALGGELAISVDHAMTQGVAWGHSPAGGDHLSRRARSSASDRLAG